MEVKKGRGYKQWEDFKDEMPESYFEDILMSMKWDNPEFFSKYLHRDCLTKVQKKEYRSYVYESRGFDFKDIISWVNNEYNKKRSRSSGDNKPEDRRIYKNQYSPTAEEAKIIQTLKDKKPKYIKTTTA